MLSVIAERMLAVGIL